MFDQLSVQMLVRFPGAPHKGKGDPWTEVPPEQSSVRLGSDAGGAMAQSTRLEPWEQCPVDELGVETGRGQASEAPADEMAGNQ